MFGAVLHGHLATTQVLLRHFRNGNELETVDEDRHYDFNYQQYKILEKPLTVKPVSMKVETGACSEIANMGTR